MVVEAALEHEGRRSRRDRHPGRGAVRRWLLQRLEDWGTIRRGDVPGTSPSA
jgi:hypothetical protein